MSCAFGSPAGNSRAQKLSPDSDRVSVGSSGRPHPKCSAFCPPAGGNLAKMPAQFPPWGIVFSLNFSISNWEANILSNSFTKPTVEGYLRFPAENMFGF